RVFSWAPISNFRNSEVLQKPAKAGFCVSGPTEFPKPSLPDCPEGGLMSPEGQPSSVGKPSPTPAGKK
ncbi:hypothetical protein, partial [Pseudomonas asplenii]|uniref:hypothetical protein n=1 Tax=Pseudomonas asplenii TaxID=53407 RepID=UPI001E5559AB